METLVTTEGTKAVLQAGGDLVAATVPSLRPRLRELVQGGIRDLVFDLEHTRMVDSSGIGLIMAAHNSMEKVGGRVHVLHASADIRTLFATMRLNQHIDIADA